MPRMWRQWQVANCTASQGNRLEIRDFMGCGHHRFLWPDGVCGQLTLHGNCDGRLDHFLVRAFLP